MKKPKKLVGRKLAGACMRSAVWHLEKAVVAMREAVGTGLATDDDLAVAVKALKTIASSTREGPGNYARGVAAGALRRILVQQELRK